MTEIVFTHNYRTQAELKKAYARLGHTPPATRRWEATLLVTQGLRLQWACPVLTADPEQLDSGEREPEYPRDWHVIAEAGELDWPPLKPEDVIWPALLDRHPVPTGEEAKKLEAFEGRPAADVHRENLRVHYLSDAHVNGIKRRAGDVNFDPIVRDWDATARELAAFVDTHRPPLLTAEQRVMVQGVHVARLESELATAKVSLAHLMRNAADDQPGHRPRHGLKSDMARWGGVTRPTVDAWLAQTDTVDVDDVR